MEMVHRTKGEGDWEENGIEEGRGRRWKGGKRGLPEGIHRSIHWRVEVPGDVRSRGGGQSATK